MYTAIVIVHIVACFAVILVVLLQKGKGADLGAAFGGSSQTVFGSQGAGGFLTKLVAACVAIFMITSLTLAYVSSKRVQATIMKGPEQAAEAVPGGTDQPAPSEDPASPMTEESESATPASGESDGKTGG